MICPGFSHEFLAASICGGLEESQRFLSFKEQLELLETRVVKNGEARLGFCWDLLGSPGISWGSMAAGWLVEQLFYSLSQSWGFIRFHKVSIVMEVPP